MALRGRSHISGLEDHLGYWLRMVSNRVSQSFAGKLENFDVTVAEWVVLREMYETYDITSPSQIADVTGLSRGAISKLVYRLLQKKLVSCRDSDSDRRYQDIKLTTKARELVPRLAENADENDREFFSVLSLSEREDFLRILRKLSDHHELKNKPIN